MTNIRPIWKKRKIAGQILVETPNTKFRRNPFRSSRFETRQWL